MSWIPTPGTPRSHVTGKEAGSYSPTSMRPCLHWCAALFRRGKGTILYRELPPPPPLPMERGLRFTPISAALAAQRRADRRKPREVWQAWPFSACAFRQLIWISSMLVFGKSCRWGPALRRFGPQSLTAPLLILLRKISIIAPRRVLGLPSLCVRYSAHFPWSGARVVELQLADGVLTIHSFP